MPLPSALRNSLAPFWGTTNKNALVELSPSTMLLLLASGMEYKVVWGPRGTNSKVWVTETDSYEVEWCCCGSSDCMTSASDLECLCDEEHFWEVGATKAACFPSDCWGADGRVGGSFDGWLMPIAEWVKLFWCIYSSGIPILTYLVQVLALSSSLQWDFSILHHTHALSFTFKSSRQFKHVSFKVNKLLALHALNSSYSTFFFKSLNTYWW